MLAPCLLWLLLQTAAAQAPTFRTGVSLVRIDAEVIDGSRLITGLNAADFVVTDNGESQAIVHFSEGEEPLDLLLLFDVSGSMKETVMEIAASARVALSQLRAGDRVGVMAFSTKARLVTPLTEDFEVVNRTIPNVLRHVGGGTFILAAADTAADYLLEVPQADRRRVVLVVTDNLGVRNRHERDVVKKYWEANAVLTGVIVSTPRLDRVRRVRRIDPLWRLLSQGMDGVAEKTGGDVLKGSDPVEAFQESIRRIRSRYSIYYRMPGGKPGERREVRVKLSAPLEQRTPGAVVRARHGYVVPGN